ncbi:MAG: tryptophan-rich sensory protein, partial [Acidimicrobiaceae bacterium]
YNFAVLIIAGLVVASRDSRTEQIIWLASLALSVAAALLWAWLFYVPHSLQASGFALGAATLLTVPLVVIAFRASPLLGLALVPYQVWVAIATSLAFGYAARN